MKIELIYDKSCPNVDLARESLKQAMEKAELKLNWLEWDQSDMDAPDYTKNFGSPTILINGQDVMISESSSKPCCRIYPDGQDGFEKAPPVRIIIESLQGAMKKQ